MKIKSNTETILSLYNKLNTKEINLNPIYQRTEGVWLIDDQKLLINSIIDNFPIPNLFFNKIKENGNGMYDCVDGKQRLTTIRNFIEGKIEVYIDGNEYLYTELPSKFRKKFDERKIGIHIVSGTNEKEIKLVFDRLQRGTNLSPSEILKTVDSQFNIKVQEFMNTYSFLTPDENGNVKLGIRQGNKRGDVFGLILKIFVLEIEGSDIKTNDIEKFLYQNTNIKSNQKNSVEKIGEIFNFLNTSFTDEEFKNIKSFYSFVTIYYLLSLVYDKHGIDSFNELKEFISDLITALSTNKDKVPNELKKFLKIKEISQEGWDTKPKILERNNILLSIINEEGITSEILLDESFLLYNYRNFTDEIYNTISELVNKNIGYKTEVLANYPNKFNEIKNKVEKFDDFRLFISDIYTIVYESLDVTKISNMQDSFNKKDSSSILFWLNEFRTFLHHNPADTQGGRFPDEKTRENQLILYINGLNLGFKISSFDDLQKVSIVNISKLKNFLLEESKNLLKEILSKNI